MLLLSYQRGVWYKKPTCSRPHISLCIPVPVIGYCRNMRRGLGVSCGGGNEGKDGRGRENRGGGCVFHFKLRPQAQLGEMKHGELTVAGAKVLYIPQWWRGIFNTSFICMCSIKSPADPAGVAAAGVSSLCAHSGLPEMARVGRHGYVRALNLFVRVYFVGSDAKEKTYMSSVPISCLYNLPFSWLIVAWLK